MRNLVTFVHRRIFLILFVLVTVCFSAHAAEPKTLLALGDSYTIGHGVSESSRWPVQLVKMLKEKGLNAAAPQIIARTGWTTRDLMQAIERENLEGSYDCVALMIGVNNQYQRLPEGRYRIEFEALLKKSIQLAGDDPAKVIVISIPDWGMSPFGTGQNRFIISARINGFNQINRGLAQQQDVAYVDVTKITREVGTDSKMYTNDGLHPSKEQYARWAQSILPAAYAIFKNSVEVNP